MNVDQLEKLWTRQTLAGGAVPPDRLVERLEAESQRRCRALQRVIAVAAFVAVASTAVTVGAHVTRIRPLTPVTLTTSLVGVVFAAGCFLFALRSLRRIRRAAVKRGASLREALAGALQSVDRQIADCRRAFVACALGLMLSIGSALARGSAGEAPAVGVLWSAVASSLFVLAVALTLYRFYARDLLPRRAELRRQEEEFRTGGILVES